MQKVDSPALRHQRQELPQEQGHYHDGASGVNPLHCQTLTACNRLGLTFQIAAAGLKLPAAAQYATTADVCSRQAFRCVQSHFDMSVLSPPAQEGQPEPLPCSCGVQPGGIV